jgi:hypothetical protein
MRKFIPILLVLGFIVIGCDSILGEIEEVETGIKCDEVSLAGAMLGDDVDTSISEICKDTCLRNVMEYSPDYRCHATSLKLICSCIVTPEREEQIAILEEQKKTREINVNCESLCKSERVCEDTYVNYEHGETYDIPIQNCDCRCVSNYPYSSLLLTGKKQGVLGQLQPPKEVVIIPKETKGQEIKRLVQDCEKPSDCRGPDCQRTEKANCYRYIAIHTENVSWCDKAGQNSIFHCVMLLALYAKNASICETEIPHGLERISCIKYVTEDYVYAPNDQYMKYEDERNSNWRDRFK